VPLRKHNFLVDTSFHISYFFDGQDLHSIAVDAVEYIKRTYPCYGFITTHLIFLETMTTVLHDKKMERAIPNKNERKQLADGLAQDIIKHCEIRNIPEDMFIDIWNLYTSNQGKKIGLEYVDCSTLTFVRDIRKHKYESDHRITFDSILSFNPRHLNESICKSFGVGAFDYSVM